MRQPRIGRFWRCRYVRAVRIIVVEGTARGRHLGRSNPRRLEQKSGSAKSLASHRAASWVDTARPRVRVSICRGVHVRKSHPVSEVPFASEEPRQCGYHRNQAKRQICRHAETVIRTVRTAGLENEDDHIGLRFPARGLFL